MTASLNIQTIVSAPFDENTYVVWQPGASEAIVFDPGLEPDLILDFLRDQELGVSAILNTHGHADHIGGNKSLKHAFPGAPLVIGKDDAFMLLDADANLSAPFGIPIISPKADRTVTEGDVVECAGIRLEVLDLPGHSPGHVGFLWRGEPYLLFGGDVLFRGSIGRSDFPGGDFHTLLRSIREKLFLLPHDTVVYPGHGPATKVGYEKRTNPFAGDPS
jgi:glyoxylase-like metal-dependent hydrolase (beta-lactamase superfamily II)